MSIELTFVFRIPVVRWHSFQRSSSGRPDSLSMAGQSPPGSPGEVPVELSCPVAAPSSSGRVQLSSLSCGQLLVLRKLALLKLTACMERYCPTHRTGWNWELPKFIRKIKAPDYKGKFWTNSNICQQLFTQGTVFCFIGNF